MHIKNDHEAHQIFKCAICGKGFVIEWRLKKHMQLHTQNNVKPCHYFNNYKSCPFNELGCKFLHSVAENCLIGQKCKRRLCPNRHVDSTIEDKQNSEILETEETDFNTIMTSTPKKRTFQCEECTNGQQCIDCYVMQDNLGVKVHFSDGL
jgi:hypothetical protein